MIRKYDMNGKGFLVLDGELYVQCQEAETVEPTLKTSEKRAPANGSGKEKKVRRCKKCGEPGHRSDNCPKDASRRPMKYKKGKKLPFVPDDGGEEPEPGFDEEAEI